METTVNYILESDDDDRKITIQPVSSTQPGSSKCVKGVFSLTEGVIDKGDIVFDDNMNQWEYTGMGDLSHAQAAQIAMFIKSNY